MSPPKRKFYPSSSGFMLGDTVVTKYNSGCLRSILIKAHGVTDGPIPEAYQRAGRFAEDDYLTKLPDTALREHPIKHELSPTVTYSGRADFVVMLDRGRTEVHEIKGHTSKSTRLDVIRKGNYNVSYLAQVLSYMVRLRTPFGKLICNYIEEDGGVLVLQESRTFDILISEHGGIHVDGKPSGYNVGDLLAHQAAAVEVLETDRVAARPDGHDKRWGQGPCGLCPFRNACDAYDALGCDTAEDLVRMAKDAVAALPPRKVPEINQVSKRKKGKT